MVGFKAFMSNSGIDEFAHADDVTLYEGMAVCARLGGSSPCTPRTTR